MRDRPDTLVWHRRQSADKAVRNLHEAVRTLLVAGHQHLAASILFVEVERQASRGGGQVLDDGPQLSAEHPRVNPLHQQHRQVRALRAPLGKVQRSGVIGNKNIQYACPRA